MNTVVIPRKKVWLNESPLISFSHSHPLLSQRKKSPRCPFRQRCPHSPDLWMDFFLPFGTRQTRWSFLSRAKGTKEATPVDKPTLTTASECGLFRWKIWWRCGVTTWLVAGGSCDLRELATAIQGPSFQRWRSKNFVAEHLFEKVFFPTVGYIWPRYHSSMKVKGVFNSSLRFKNRT